MGALINGPADPLALFFCKSMIPSRLFLALCKSIILSRLDAALLGAQFSRHTEDSNRHPSLTMFALGPSTLAGWSFFARVSFQASYLEHMQEYHSKPLVSAPSTQSPEEAMQILGLRPVRRQWSPHCGTSV